MRFRERASLSSVLGLEKMAPNPRKRVEETTYYEDLDPEVRTRNREQPPGKKKTASDFVPSIAFPDMSQNGVEVKESLFRY